MSIRIFIKSIRFRDFVDLSPFLTVKEAKKRLQDKLMCNQDQCRWFFNARLLDDCKTLSDNGVSNNSVISISEKGPVGGGCAINVVDVSKNQTRIIEFDPNAPFYRRVDYGLNVQAVCSNPNCKAYNDCIYCPLGFVCSYNIIKNLDQIKCPACKEEVYPKNFGFLNCKYKAEYTIYKDNSKMEGEVEGEAGEKYKTFDEASGNADFTKLIFTITRN